MNGALSLFVKQRRIEIVLLTYLLNVEQFNPKPPVSYVRTIAWGS